MILRLDRRVALVTGGARSIGAAIADGMAEAGAIVVVGDLVESPIHRSIELDVSNEKSVKNAIDRIVSDHGRLDILVNNAGIMFETNIADQEREPWDRMMAINVTGPMMLTRHAAPHLATSGMGVIINISSLEGNVCNPNHAAYAASKAAVQGLTRATAIDLGPETRCNAISPGWIDTPLNAAYIDGHADRDEVLSQLAKLHPVGRIGSPVDVADVAVWLASDESRFVTGQNITVDGGRTTRPPLPLTMG